MSSQNLAQSITSYLALSLWILQLFPYFLVNGPVRHKSPLVAQIWYLWSFWYFCYNILGDFALPYILQPGFSGLTFAFCLSKYLYGARRWGKLLVTFFFAAILAVSMGLLLVFKYFSFSESREVMLSFGIFSIITACLAYLFQLRDLLSAAEGGDGVNIWPLTVEAFGTILFIISLIFNTVDLLSFLVQLVMLLFNFLYICCVHWKKHRRYQSAQDVSSVFVDRDDPVVLSK